MAQTIEVGTLLVEEGADLPASVTIESDPYLKGWSLVRNLSSADLDRKLRDLGWTFFYMAGELNAMDYGSNLEKTTRKAIGRITAKLKSGKFNCLEISRVAAKSFLGVPYVAVAGHARHIQESLYLFHAKPISAWVQPKLAAA